MKKENFSVKEEGVFKNLFNNMSSGMMICEVIYNAKGQMVDCRYLMMNQAYADLNGLKIEEAME